MKNKFKGSLLGGAIGDALGYQIEFQREIKEREITRFNRKGFISDDTQMTLFTANALIWRETLLSLNKNAPSPVDAIYLGYKDWYDTQMDEEKNKSISWLKKIKELNCRRAPGNTCIMALASTIKGTIQKPLNNSKGCGTVMRIAPIGLYNENPEQAGYIASEASALTHGHPLGIIPSYVLAYMISLIVHESKSILEALNQSLESLKAKKDLFPEEDIITMENLLQKVVELSQQNTSDIEAITELGEGWVAEEALAIALYACLKYPNSLEDSIICAVNHDGDSDSTGAIAGNIIGASLGIEAIPNYYLEELELRDIILEIAEDLYAASTHSYEIDEYWISKYVYQHRDLTKRK